MKAPALVKQTISTLPPFWLRLWHVWPRVPRWCGARVAASACEARHHACALAATDSKEGGGSTHESNVSIVDTWNCCDQERVPCSPGVWVALSCVWA